MKQKKLNIIQLTKNLMDAKKRWIVSCIIVSMSTIAWFSPNAIIYSIGVLSTFISGSFCILYTTEYDEARKQLKYLTDQIKKAT